MVVRSSNDDCSTGFISARRCATVFLQHFTELLIPSKLRRKYESWLQSKLSTSKSRRVRFGPQNSSVSPMPGRVLGIFAKPVQGTTPLRNRPVKSAFRAPRLRNSGPPLRPRSHLNSRMQSECARGDLRLRAPGSHRIKGAPCRLEEPS